MNSPRIGLRVASVLFGIFAIGHLVRLINQARVTVGTLTIPMGVSWIALVVAAILCVWLWRLASRTLNPLSEIRCSVVTIYESRHAFIACHFASQSRGTSRYDSSSSPTDPHPSSLSVRTRSARKMSIARETPAPPAAPSP